MEMWTMIDDGHITNYYLPPLSLSPSSWCPNNMLGVIDIAIIFLFVVGTTSSSHHHHHYYAVHAGFAFLSRCSYALMMTYHHLSCMSLIQQQQQHHHHQQTRHQLLAFAWADSWSSSSSSSPSILTSSLVTSITKANNRIAVHGHTINPWTYWKWNIWWCISWTGWRSSIDSSFFVLEKIYFASLIYEQDLKPPADAHFSFRTNHWCTG
mgnify:CR=1 FL=1